MRQAVTALLPFALVAAVWQAISSAGIVDRSVLPSAFAVARALVELLAAGELYANLAVTLERCLLGLIVGALVGVPLGAGMAVSPRLAGFFGPLIRATYSLPKTAIVPLLLLWFGVGLRTEVGAVILSALLPITTYTYHGVQDVPPIIIWSARAMGTPRHLLLWRVLMPASMQETLAGLRIALGFSFVIGIAVEMLASNEGIGKMIFIFGETGAVDYMFATVFALVCVAFVIDAGMARASRFVLRWRPIEAADV